MYKIPFLMMCLSAPILLSLSVTGDDKELEKITEKLKELLHQAMNDFKMEMSVGFPETGIPPLDPLDIESMSFDIEQNSVKADIKLEKVKLKSMSKFTVSKLEINVKALTLDMTLDYFSDAITVSGNYDIKGLIMKIIPIYGKGPFGIKVQGLKVRGSSKIRVTPEHVTVDAANMDLEWKHLDLKMEGLFGGTLDKVLKEALPLLGEKAFRAFRPLIMSKISQALAAFMNTQMKHPQLKELVKRLIGEIINPPDERK